MSNLPAERRIIHGRTFHTSWSPHEMAPITRYRRRRRADIAFGLAMAGVVVLVVVAIAKGYVFGPLQ